MGKSWALVGVGLIVAVWPAASESAGAGLSQMKGQIVFSSNRSGSWAIWRVQANGKGLHQLTRPKDGAADVDPDVSPDGKSIVFTSTRGGKTGVWKMQADGSKLDRICDGDQGEWSHDGKNIVFRRDERIYRRDLGTGKEKLLSPKDWPHCSGPAWSPDGKTIAFAARWEKGNGIFLVPADGGVTVKVYDKEGACEPHWSPDGKWLAYETGTHVRKVRPDGTKNRYVTVHAGVQRYPRWSPDGKHLVFCQGVTEKGPWELYIVSALGGFPVKLTEDGSDVNPDWK